MPAHLREFDPEDWGAAWSDCHAPDRGAEPRWYTAMAQYHRARAEWRLAHGWTLRELSSRERVGLWFAA